jgi:hypothetical protein
MVLTLRGGLGDRGEQAQTRLCACSSPRARQSVSRTMKSRSLWAQAGSRGLVPARLIAMTASSMPSRVRRCSPDAGRPRAGCRPWRAPRCRPRCPRRSAPWPRSRASC